MKKLYRLVIFLFIAVLVTASGTTAARAQIVGATLTGTVHDTTGATLRGATVTVRQIETGASRTLITGADGR